MQETCQNDFQIDLANTRYFSPSPLGIKDSLLLSPYRELFPRVPYINPLNPFSKSVLLQTLDLHGKCCEIGYTD